MSFLDFSNDKESSFDVIPKGVYPVRIDSVEEAKSKAGNMMIKSKFIITDGEYKGRVLFHNFNMQGNETAVKISRGQIKSLLTLSGKPQKIDSIYELVGIEVMASITVRKTEDFGDQNQISAFKKLEESKSDSANPFA